MQQMYSWRMLLVNQIFIIQILFLNLYDAYYLKEVPLNLLTE